MENGHSSYFIHFDFLIKGGTYDEKEQLKTLLAGIIRDGAACTADWYAGERKTGKRIQTGRRSGCPCGGSKIPLKEDFTFALAADQSAVYDSTAKTLIAKFLPNEAVSVTLKTYDASGKETAMLQAGTYTVKAKHGGGWRLCSCKRS